MKNPVSQGRYERSRQAFMKQLATDLITMSPKKARDWNKLSGILTDFWRSFTEYQIHFHESIRSANFRLIE
jgi:hypothetical protein